MRAVYSYDYAPYWHLKGKTEYLLKTKPEALFIFLLNKNPAEVLRGEGLFQHIECDVIKSINFAQRLHLDIMGIVENMSGFQCPHCGGHVDLFRKGGGEEAAPDGLRNGVRRVAHGGGVDEGANGGIPRLQGAGNTCARRRAPRREMRGGGVACGEPTDAPGGAPRRPWRSR